VVQYLCTRQLNDLVNDLGLNNLHGLKVQFASAVPDRKVWLPREIIAAAGQVEVQTTEPYISKEEEKFRQPGDDADDPFGYNQLFNFAGAQFRGDSFIIPWQTLGRS
jgi:hypothetical protein